MGLKLINFNGFAKIVGFSPLYFEVNGFIGSTSVEDSTSLDPTDDKSRLESVLKSWGSPRTSSLPTSDTPAVVESGLPNPLHTGDVIVAVNNIDACQVSFERVSEYSPLLSLSDLYIARPEYQ